MALHRVYNTTKRAIRKWRRDRIAQRHAGETIDPSAIDISSVRKALIVLPNWRMGNLLLVTPAAQWLCERLRRSGVEDPVVDICSGGNFAAILAGNPHVRRHISIPRFVHRIERARLRRALRDEAYDLVLMANYSGDPLASGLVLATGARWRVGAGRMNIGPLNVCVKRPDKDDYVTDQHRSVLEQLGFAPDPEADLTMVSTEEEMGEARDTVAGWNLGEGRRPLGLFVCGHRIKQIAFDKWARIIERLRTDFSDLEPVVFQGPGEARKIAKLQRALGERRVRVVATSLRRFCALVECMEAFVTCDTGPMHLARAKRLPMVSLFTKPNHEKFAPQGRGRVVLFRAGGPNPDEVSEGLRRALSER